MIPTLNWKELALLVERLKPWVEEAFVDRVIIPGRPRFPDGYLKGEWTLRLSSRRQERALSFGIRPRQPYLALTEGKGMKSAGESATQSAFGLALSKFLRGARISKLEALHRERTIVIWFEPTGGESARLGLVLTLIPATPEALLVQADTGQSAWPILARSRIGAQKGTQREELGVFTPPDGSKAPDDLPLRTELVSEPGAFGEIVERELEAEAFQQRRLIAERRLREISKQALDRIRQTETSLREARAEAEWRRYGNLLKANLGGPDAVFDAKTGTRSVMDFESGSHMAIPCDPKLDSRAQVEKFYSLARRKQRRIKEAELRLSDLRAAQSRAETLLASAPQALDWPALEAWESRAGGGPAASEAPAKNRKAGGALWLGKTFVSRDGWAILVGRSKTENLELTFKHARGNDLWMHVRGKPGAHVVIPVQPGKSVPLETLLDAATLCVFYSGGQSWGKTEVDYTFKKHVKRIKDSTEASYTQNRTLLVEIQQERMKRLMAE